MNAITEHAGTARIVVGVDGSEQSKHALRWAAWLAGTLDASIDAVIVWQPPVAMEYNWTTTIGDWDPHADSEKGLTATVDEVFGPDRPARMRLLVVEGNPAWQLMKQATGATMLIVGTRGRGGFASLALGSVSVHCVEHAPCPVLVVRNDPPHAATGPTS
jgi:nucleotide-binding universal stress UspA family protein